MQICLFVLKCLSKQIISFFNIKDETICLVFSLTRYVKSYLFPDKAHLGKRKTSVKKKTLSPSFNEILRVRHLSALRGLCHTFPRPVCQRSPHGRQSRSKISRLAVVAVSCSPGVPPNPDAHSLRVAPRHLWQEQLPG